MEDAIGMRARFCLTFQTNPNQAQDVLVDRGQCLVQQPLHGRDMRTRRLCLIPHPSPIDGQDGEPGEFGKYSPNNPRLEDPRTGATSPDQHSRERLHQRHAPPNLAMSS
jgi:hypothetical protein